MENKLIPILPDDWGEDMRLLCDLLSAGINGIGTIPKHALAVLYAHFCGIQAATWLDVNDQTAERFRCWFYSGDDDDAWS